MVLERNLSYKGLLLALCLLHSCLIFAQTPTAVYKHSEYGEWEHFNSYLLEDNEVDIDYRLRFDVFVIESKSEYNVRYTVQFRNNSNYDFYFYFTIKPYFTDDFNLVYKKDDYLNWGKVTINAKQIKGYNCSTMVELELGRKISKYLYNNNYETEIALAKIQKINRKDKDLKGNNFKHIEYKQAFETYGCLWCKYHRKEKNNSTCNSDVFLDDEVYFQSLNTGEFVDGERKDNKNDLTNNQSNQLANQSAAAQNTAATEGIAAVGGLMALLKDQTSKGWFSAKFRLGLGYESLPVISNGTTVSKSKTEGSNQFQFTAGFNVGLSNSKAISFYLSPEFTYGLNALQTGTDGGQMIYGGLATLQIGLKHKSKFKLVAEGGYFKRKGEKNFDQDVASGGTTATDYVTKSVYDYSFLRYGGGFMIHILDGEEEGYFKPVVYFDQFSFAKNEKPTMIGGVKIMYNKVGILEFLYSKNYAIGGDLKYKYNFDNKNKNYFQIKFIRQGRLK